MDRGRTALQAMASRPTAIEMVPSDDRGVTLRSQLSASKWACAQAGFLVSAHESRQSRFARGLADRRH